MHEPELRRRLRAACCPFHGLTEAQLDAHIERIALVIEAARERQRVEELEQRKLAGRRRATRRS